MSPAVALSSEGAAAPAIDRSTPLMFATLRRNRGYCSASAGENVRIDGARRVRPEHERAIVAGRSARVRGRPDDVQAPLLEAERPHERRIDGRGMSERGQAEAWRELRRDRAAAHPFRPLEHERPQARLGKKRRGDEPVVPAAHDDHFTRTPRTQRTPRT
jgi:hypothetical protein